MRKLVAVLAATTVIFAATTAYFARQLAIERERGTKTATNVVAMKPAAPVPPLVQVPTSTPAPKPDTPAVENTSADELMEERMAKTSRKFLEQITDPARRAKLLAEYERNARVSYPRLAERLGLSSETYEHLIDLFAAQDLASREGMARCILDEICEARVFNRNAYESRSRQIAELLGATVYQRFEEYTDSLSERETVTRLRAHLTDEAYLPSEVSELLISALADERKRMQAEAAHTGRGLGGFGVADGFIWYDSRGTPEEQLASAESYVQRMRDRAAQVLEPRQLAVYEEMNANVLANLRGQIEKREVIAAKR